MSWAIEVEDQKWEEEEARKRKAWKEKAMRPHVAYALGWLGAEDDGLRRKAFKDLDELRIEATLELNRPKYGPLDDVFQFSHISRPGIAKEHIDCS